MLKCESRIVKTFKRKKANSVNPFYAPDAMEKYPEVCGGEVTVEVRTEVEPYFGGSDTILTVEATCTRCKRPWVDELDGLKQEARSGSIKLDKLLE